MTRSELLSAIENLPDPQHPSTQIAQRAAVEIKKLSDALNIVYWKLADSAETVTVLDQLALKDLLEIRSR